MSINNVISVQIFIQENESQFPEDEETNNRILNIANAFLELSKTPIRTHENLSLVHKEVLELNKDYRNLSEVSKENQGILQSIKVLDVEGKKDINQIERELRIFQRNFPLYRKDTISRVKDVIFTVSCYCDVKTLLSISCLNKYFNKLCNDHMWIHVPKSSVEEYAKELLQNDLCRYTGYVDYLKDGNWTDLIKLTLKLGSIALPIFSFIKSSFHFGNIPADAPKILVECFDENDVSYFREEYDHPEYFLYSKFITLGVFSSLVPISLLLEIAHFYFDENGARNKFLNRLQQVDNETREYVQDISLITHYVSPEFFEWKIERINENKQKIQKFILKLENKLPQNQV
ncbi:MAG TPA: hypothetical protein VIH61_00830 [Waddliaceae bacterium]